MLDFFTPDILTMIAYLAGAILIGGTILGGCLYVAELMGWLFS